MGNKKKKLTNKDFKDVLDRMFMSMTVGLITKCIEKGIPLPNDSISVRPKTRTPNPAVRFIKPEEVQPRGKQKK